MRKLNDQSRDWIFFLKLTPKLPTYFYQMDALFKKFNMSLIPITLSHFLELTKSHETTHIVCIVRNYKELSYYIRKSSKLLKMLLRMDRIILHHASSFEAINEGVKLRHRDNYFYHALPIEKEELCYTILSKIISGPSKKDIWPGGRSPKITIEK